MCLRWEAWQFPVGFLWRDLYTLQKHSGVENYNAWALTINAMELANHVGVCESCS